MAVGLLSAAAALLGILTAVEIVMDDREGWISPFIVGLGRVRYAAVCSAVSTAVAVAAVAPAAALYSLLRPASAAPVAAASVASAAVGAALGILIGFSASTRGYAYAWGVSLWTALALIYELAPTFTSIYFAVSEPFFAAALLANPLTAARLVGIALADPSLLTLGPAGTYLYKFPPHCPKGRGPGDIRREEGPPQPGLRTSAGNRHKAGGLRAVAEADPCVRRDLMDAFISLFIHL
jgi:hypothetical protein